MYRYFVLIWNPGNPAATATARVLAERMISLPPGWARVLEADGVYAFHAGLGEGAGRTWLLDQDAGAVFGRIFQRDMDDSTQRDMDDSTRAQRVELDPKESLSIVQTGGRRLFERYWGRYVALVQDAATSETWILRDPTGAMPCLMTEHQGVRLVFSDLEDCFALGIRQFSINWDYIRLLLPYSGYQSRETALNEVSEVQFGERVRISGDTLHRSLEWDPLAIARTDPLQDADLAVQELRRTTRGCIHTWASCYADIVHNLSGGLDSSIVLSCLKDAPSHPNITCLHYYGTGPDEDERKYARLMAKRLQVELIEHQLDVQETRLQDLLRLRRSARPWFYMYELEHGRFEGQLAAERQAQALFSGAGGDGVFFQAKADLAVTDYLFDHGVGSALVGIAVAAARVSRRSIWPLLLNAMRARMLPRRWHPLQQPDAPERVIISQEVLQAARSSPKLIHPWFAGHATHKVPPGRLWHVMSVSAAPLYYSCFQAGPYPERTLPLMSQPLIELCLRTPTYVLIKYGMDRSIARRAFAPDLPPEIARRRNKGRIDRHVRNVVDANLPLLRDMLLNGRLVKEGLLNRQNLELYLTRERSPADFQYAEILHEHLCIEAWLSRWLDSREAASASDGLEPAIAHQFLRT